MLGHMTYYNYKQRISVCHMTFLNNLIWYVSHFLIGWKIASISVWMKKKNKQATPPFELLFVVMASTQSKLIGTNSSSH